jgi:hypothetical protein
MQVNNSTTRDVCLCVCVCVSSGNHSMMRAVLMRRAPMSAHMQHSHLKRQRTCLFYTSYDSYIYYYIYYYISIFTTIFTTYIYKLYFLLYFYYIRVYIP